MSRARVDLNISLDGFATTTDETPENPFGEDWSRLTAAIAPIILGHGIRLWDDLRGLEADSDVTAEGAESGVVHVTLQRKAVS